MIFDRDGVAFVKGRGAQNDFILLPDLDGALDPSPRLVRALCDHRRALDYRGQAEWFMGYHNPVFVPNPHAVVFAEDFAEDFAEAGALTTEHQVEAQTLFPDEIDVKPTRPAVLVDTGTLDCGRRKAQ